MICVGVISGAKKMTEKKLRKSFSDFHVLTLDTGGEASRAQAAFRIPCAPAHHIRAGRLGCLRHYWSVGAVSADLCSLVDIYRPACGGGGVVSAAAAFKSIPHYLSLHLPLLPRARHPPPPPHPPSSSAHVGLRVGGGVNTVGSEKNCDCKVVVVQ